MMKLRGIFLLALILFAAPAMAQVNPGTSPLSIPKGGTGGATAAAARTSLGLGSIATQNANAVAITGGTVTGLPTPSVAADAANKSYVDGVAAGISTLSASRLATTAVLPNTPTYANGTAGVGATLTAGANSTLTVDGTVANLNDLVLVKNQAAPAQNGIYTVTTAGGGVPWVLTRASYFNTAAQMKAGSYTFITAGATLTSNSFVLAAAVTTVGTDPLNFNLFTYFGGVAAINGNTGGFTLNSASGVTNNINDVVLQQATASQFGAVRVDNASIKATSGVISANGASVLLNTLTASGTPATLSDTTSLTGAYSTYEIILENLVPALSGATCEIQVHSAAAFQNTGYLANEMHFASASVGSVASTTYIPCSNAVANAVPGTSGSFRIYTPSLTTTPKNWTGIFSHAFTGGTVNVGGSSSGYWNANGAVDGFQVLFSSGNISSGIVKIYGKL
jgi:hypothetical protein